jgi:hypothetical protein
MMSKNTAGTKWNKYDEILYSVMLGKSLSVGYHTALAEG